MFLWSYRLTMVNTLESLPYTRGSLMFSAAPPVEDRTIVELAQVTHSQRLCQYCGTSEIKINKMTLFASKLQ